MVEQVKSESDQHVTQWLEEHMKKKKDVFKHEIQGGREVPHEHKNIHEEIEQFHI